MTSLRGVVSWSASVSKLLDGRFCQPQFVPLEGRMKPSSTDRNGHTWATRATHYLWQVFHLDIFRDIVSQPKWQLFPLPVPLLCLVSPFLIVCSEESCKEFELSSGLADRFHKYWQRAGEDHESRGHEAFVVVDHRAFSGVELSEVQFRTESYLRAIEVVRGGIE